MLSIIKTNALKREEEEEKNTKIIVKVQYRDRRVKDISWSSYDECELSYS